MAEIRIPPGLGREPSPERPKRFYATAGVEARDDGFALVLDGRGARTPARRALVLPRREAAEALATEWSAQGPLLDPSTMPLTRLVNSAIDGVADAVEAVRSEIKSYLAADLVIYRAGEPEALVRAQATAWDPLVDWVAETYGARLILAEGVTFVAQPAESLKALGAGVDAAAGEGAAVPFRLAALHAITTLTGSAILALAVARARLAAEAAWSAAHVDEQFQEERWGRDEEALARRARRFAEMEAAARLLATL